MSDIYHKDTTEALDNFVDKISELKGILDSDFTGCFELLAEEVQGLLDQYASNIDDLEAAKELVEELDKQA